MKKTIFFALALLLIGSFAFAQSEGVAAEINFGFIMDMDKEKDVDTLIAPGIDLGLRAYFMNMGNEYQPMNFGLATEFSLGFPGMINWKVPGLKQLKKDSSGNAFWPGNNGGVPPGGTANPIKVGSQTLEPGKTVQFSKAKHDFDSDAGLVNVSFLVGASFQTGFGGGIGIVADLGFAGSYDVATFKSPSYDSVKEVGKKEKQVIELSTFNGGIGGNLGLQYRIPLAGNSELILEAGSGLYVFFSRTSEVNWYAERDGEKKETFWKDKTDPESISLFRAAPYLTVGLRF